MRKKTAAPVSPENAEDAVEASPNLYSVGVLNKTTFILQAFTHEHPRLALKDVAAKTGLPKTTVFRILSSLIEHDFCEFDERTGEYGLGFALLRLADVRRRQTNVHDIALPIMREMRNDTNETVVLSIRSGDARVHVDLVESLHALRRSAELGVRAPLYAGASSKVLLAGMEDDEIHAYLNSVPLVPISSATITDKGLLWKEIAQIRERGYAESRGEVLVGGGALAAPIKGYDGKTVAVFDILTPSDRYTPEHRERCIEFLLAGAKKASERFGYRG
jgi:DNA-binding IclR family transcriptional regulator